MSGHTTRESVVVGSRWRMRKTGLIYAVVKIDPQYGSVQLKRETPPRSSFWKWIDLLLFDYELLPDEEVRKP